MKPLLSPIEVLLALGYCDYSDSSAFTTSFQPVLAAKTDVEDSAAGEVDASNGQLVASRPLNVAVVGQSAVQRLNERSYVGLDPQLGQTAVQTEIIEGRHGIAKGYVERQAQN